MVKWTDELDSWLRETVPGRTASEVADMMNARFGTDATASSVSNRKVKLGIKCGCNPGRFRKGQEPWNKGRPISEWMPPESIERSASTRFKPGNVPHNARDGLGHERQDTKDGRVMVKVREHRESGKPNTYELRARVVWEREFGPIPEGCVIRHADGDNANDEPGNLRLVTKRQNAWLNHDESKRLLNAESFDAMLALADVSARINDIRKESKG